MKKLKMYFQPDLNLDRKYFLILIKQWNTYNVHLYNEINDY